MAPSTALLALAAAVAVIALLATAPIGSFASAGCPGSGWTGMRTLNAGAEFTLSYKVDQPNDLLVIRLRAKTTGWLGFGLSESGHMIGADIVTAAVDNGVARLEDRFTAWDAYPLDFVAPAEDKCQHWKAVCAFEDATHTEMILSRPLNTSDSQDRVIVQGEMFVIYAWGPGDTVTYHGSRRGSTSVDFYAETSASFVPPADATATVDVTLNNYVLKNTRTQYVLQLVDLTAQNRHVVAVEPLIKPADQAFVHHILVHDCGPVNIFPLTGTPVPANVPFSPDTPISPLGISPCLGLVYGWAMGGGAVTFPAGTGVRIGSSGGRYVVLEVHLDNPTGASGNVITSGVKLHVAPPRQHDIGTLILGNAGANMPTLPKGQARVHREGTCPSQCTQTYKGPLQLIGSFPHMHSYGREIWTTLKGGSTQEVSVVSSKQFWNFGFQNQFALNITVNPGDSLSTHCVYDTSKSDVDIIFGTGSNDEMCMDFVMFWPKQNAGPKCGWTSGDRTECNTTTMSPAVSNPIADGTTRVPVELEVGDVPGTCLLDLGITRNPTLSPTPATADGSSKSAATSLSSNVNAVIVVFVAMLSIIGSFF